MNVIIIGAGLTGCVAASVLKKKHNVKIFEKRTWIGGNCADAWIPNLKIFKHKYGAHIFHTNDNVVIKYLNQYTNLNNYSHKVVANTKDGLIEIPMKKDLFKKYKIKGAINLIYKDYSQKQWGIPYEELPESIQNRVPKARVNDDDPRYFTDQWQGIPEYGYTNMMKEMVRDCKLELGVSLNYKDVKNSEADLIIYTGSIDQFFNMMYGRFEYRALSWIDQEAPKREYSVINECNLDKKYTRSIDHSHWNLSDGDKTIISYEFCSDYDGVNIPAYPVTWGNNQDKYQKYLDFKQNEKMNKIEFLGRMAKYHYINMDQAIKEVLERFE